MDTCLHMLRRGLVGLVVLAGAISAHTSAVAQGVAPDDTVQSVRRMLERLPYYGVFDHIVFRVDGGTVYLSGYSFEGRLKADAEMAVKRASGVVEVANAIEVLPASQNDDRVRWATFYRIYADDFLSVRAWWRARSVATAEGRATLPRHAAGRSLSDSSRRKARSNDVARRGRQCSGPPNRRSAGAEANGVFEVENDLVVVR